MAPVGHIVGDARVVLDRLGLLAPRALCGTKIPDGQLPANAPMCPACIRKAGWSHDKRR